jgi:hypothetical protein
MPKLVLSNCFVSVDGTDLSSHVASVSLETVFEIIDTTTLGSIFRTKIAGLGENSVTFEFHQDFGSGSVEATIYPLLGTRTECVIKPVNAATSSTNPSYTFQAVISEWRPISGAVGFLATVPVTFPISGEITKTII